MSFKPVLLLDVDGVVNAVCNQEDYPVAWPTESWHFTRVAANGFAWPIHYSTEVVERLNALSESVEIRWHTTWQTDALQLGRQLGFNIFPVQDAPQFQQNHASDVPIFYNWWKMYAALDVVNKERRPLIWCDDDLDIHNRIIVSQYASDPEMLCLVHPFTNIGLTKQHFDDINTFLNDWYVKTD
jgi:hypothetical protein